MRKGSRFRIRQRAADGWGAGVSESGRRRELATSELQPGDGICSISTHAQPSAFITFTMTTRSRRAGAATIAAGWPNRCCRRSTTKTGKIRWSHKWEGAGVTFRRAEYGGQSGVRRRSDEQLGGPECDDGRTAVARQPGERAENAPMTYEFDGTQYLVVGAGDTLFAFAMLRK